VLRRFCVTLALAAALLPVAAASAPARWYGSTLKGKANATYGCEAALTLGPIGGVQLSPSHQRSCTYYHAGYLYSSRPTFLVPATGRITRIQVKAGPHPAKLRLTILSGSSRVDTRTGRDLPGTYTCCTARYVGKPFRPRANAITTRKVNVRVANVVSRKLRIRIHSSDGVGISAVGPGRVPLHIRPDVAGYNTGTPIGVGFFPRTQVGDPRVDGYSMTGIDLLLRWNFRRGR
jgi:hypothetical protein